VFDLDHSRLILARTPEVLRVWLTALPEPWLRDNEGPDTWSPYDVLGHLVHGERTDWITRARIIREEGEGRPFPPFDRFAQFRDSVGKTAPDLLDEFAALRRKNLEALDAMRLGETDLARTGTHPSLGRVTLRELLATWVVHDLGHIGQIARVMAGRYGPEVGPWREYLPVLGDRRGR